MPSSCPTCSRVNPPEALFCFNDGTALGASRRNGTGPSAFPFPFVFPSGRSCRSFDELALACLDDNAAASDLLRQGALAHFLNGMGRADLAASARAASRSADADRGLDEFLGALPTRALDPPRLHVEPLRINLGVLRLGEDRRWDLHLRNQGMRLLSGTVTCAEGVWLALGDAPGSPRKVFQAAHEAVVPVHVRGRQLRAGGKPLEGRLLVESNGGGATVVVTAEVPVRPFPDGVLAGATTPRQVAEKARDHPREAAELFKTGAVARWYRDNGWAYPVPGPAASGVAAVQQFFEALGLTTPPKVELRETAVFFTGGVGATLRHTLEVTTPERRPVYAHAVSDRPWLEVSGVQAAGRSAGVRLTIPAVPDRPGEMLQARVTVTANGNQRFVVPVTLAVGARFLDGRTGPGPALAETEPASPAVVRRLPDGVPPPARPPLPAPATAAADAAAGRPDRRRRWPHALPLAFLAAGLLAALVRDLLSTPSAGGPAPAGPAVARIAVEFHDREQEVTIADFLPGEGGVKPTPGRGTPRQPRQMKWGPTMRFGVVMLGAEEAGGRRSRLTYEERGLTNNTCVRIDGRERLFGERGFRDDDGVYHNGFPGRWEVPAAPLGPDEAGRPREGRRSVWVYDDEKVRVTQTVELVDGDRPDVLDTCLVRYRLENGDDRPHRLGLRFLLDTFIGANDGVPFLVPGRQQLIDTRLDLRGAGQVPQYIQACEREDLTNPGTVARVKLVVAEVEPPDRVTLGAWPNLQLALRDRRCQQEQTLWEVPVLPIKTLDPPDSAVTMYWDERPLPPGAARGVGFAYGLGSVAGGEGGGRLAVTAGGSFTPGGIFTVTAYVRDPLPGQTVTLALPEGARPAGGAATQPVPPLPPGAASRNSPVTWTVQAPDRTGELTLKVTSSTGAAQTLTVTVKAQGIFGNN